MSILYTPPGIGQIPTIEDQITALADDLDALTELVTQQSAQVVELQGVAGVGAIYRPGATPGGNVFDTFLGALSTLRTFGGGNLIIDDGGDSSAATTDIGTLNLDGITIVGISYSTPTLNVVEGTVFTAPTTMQWNVKNVFVKWAGATAPWSITSGNLGVSLDDYAQIIADAAATGPFIAANTGGNVYIDLGYQCAITTNTGGHAAIDLRTSGACEIQCGVKSVLSADAITGGGDEALLVTNLTAGLTAGGGDASISHTQTGTTNPQFVP